MLTLLIIKLASLLLEACFVLEFLERLVVASVCVRSRRLKALSCVKSVELNSM